MYQMRESWTDAGLDDFAAHVDQRFDAVDRRFDAVDKRFDRVEGEIRAVREEGAEMQKEMNRRFDSMQKEMHRGFEGLQRMMLQASVAVIVALIALIATQV